MPDIVFPTSSAPATMSQESAGRLINAFVEKTLTGAPSDRIVRRSPGLFRVAVNPAVTDTSGFHTRGFLDVGTTALWIVNGRVLSIASNFLISDVGAFVGTEPVTTARNNAFPAKQNVVVSEDGCFILKEDGPPLAYSVVDTNLPANPTSVCDMDGYFVWSFGDGRVYASNLNTFTVNSGSFNTEQGLFARRVVRYAGRLYVFGDKWTGVYRDVGTSPFPFAREVTIPRGIVGTHAVAGWEAGWANELLWVGDDFVVYKLNGYTPVPVSTDDVSRAIQKSVLAGGRNFIEAFVYMYGKNAFWSLTSHNNWTWEYNVITGEWNERQSYDRRDWKGMKSIRMFDQWLIGDEYSGELYVISGDYFKEGTDPLVWLVESGIVSGFPNGSVIPKASFHMTNAVGSYDLVTNPVVEISWSLDGGHSFGEPVLRRLGGPGESHSFPSIMGSGLSKGQGVRYRLLVSDPVHVGLLGGIVEAQQRRWAG